MRVPFVSVLMITLMASSACMKRSAGDGDATKQRQAFTADNSPWQIESPTGGNDYGQAIDTAIAEACGEVSDVFEGRAFRGITLGEKYAEGADADESEPRMSEPWMLLHKQKEPKQAGDATLDRVLVDAQTGRIVGILTVHPRKPLVSMLEQINEQFGKSTQEIDMRLLPGSKVEAATIKYSCPDTIIRVSGNKFETQIVVLDRKYVEESLRAFANAVVSASCWIKQMIRYGQTFEEGPLPNFVLADLESEWLRDKSCVVLSDKNVVEVARKRRESNPNVICLAWDAASAWRMSLPKPYAQSEGAVVDFHISTSVGVPVLLKSRDHYVPSTLATAGVCAELFHDVGNALLQQEFPPRGETIRVLAPRSMWRPDDTLAASYHPSSVGNEQFIKNRCESLLWKGGSNRVRAFQWIDREEWRVTFTESLILTVSRSVPATP